MRLTMERVLTAFVLLAARLWMAAVFWSAGTARLANWPAQTFLFESVHPLPVLPPLAWANLTTLAELTLPILLVCGLATRIAALGMLGMTLVIQFYLGMFLVSDFAAPADFNNPEHYLWMILCLLLIAQGGGPVALDRLPVMQRLWRRILPHAL